MIKARARGERAVTNSGMGDPLSMYKRWTSRQSWRIVGQGSPPLFCERQPSKSNNTAGKSVPVSGLSAWEASSWPRLPNCCQTRRMASSRAFSAGVLPQNNTDHHCAQSLSGLNVYTVTVSREEARTSTCLLHSMLVSLHYD